MKRREFITLLGGAAATWPFAARAQQPMMALIGLLSGSHLDARQIGAVAQGLKEAGFIEGPNVAIKYRAAGGQFDRLPALAAELINDPVAVIVTIGPAASLAAKTATSTIPIVFATGADPIDLGLVPGLSRPQVITGVGFLVKALAAKRVELLHELLSRPTAIGFLINPNNPAFESETKDAEVAALALGLKLWVMNASSERDIDAAFASFAQERVNGVFIGADAVLLSHRDRIVELASRHALPAIYYVREFAAVGGLMSYGTSLPDAYRQAGVYAGRILKGDKPADLPVVQSTKFELVINLKTAKTLGLEVPPTLLARADEVIE